MRLKATLAYVGTFFHGWQIQENAARTVQAAVEGALETVTGKPARVHASGRTDAGVHADGQVVHFDEPTLPPENLLAAVNRHLPWDVRFLEIEGAPPEFHARSDARAKRYVYRFSRERVIAPREALFTAPLTAAADAALMAEAAKGLCGRHDFYPFSTAGTETETTVRTLFSCTVSEQGARVTLAMTADGFLRGMARAIAGTLADIGRRHVPRERIEEIFAANDKGLVRPKAKARGLTLERVFYEDLRNGERFR